MWKESVYKRGKRHITDFGPTPDILREEYLDIYEGIQLEILNTKRFDENSDLSTTYFAKGRQIQK